MQVPTRFAIEWKCKACGLRQAAEHASSEEPLQTPMGDSRTAHMKLARRPCPKCGVADVAGQRRFFLTTFLVTTLGTFAVLLVTMWTQLSSVSPGMLLLSPVVGGLYPTWLWHTRWMPGARDFANDPDGLSPE